MPAKAESAEPADFEQARRLFVDGLADLLAGRLAEAERQFCASLALLPDRISTLVNLAAARLGLSRPDAALEAADRVIAIEPDNVEAWFHRGSAMTQLSRWNEALRSFERAGNLSATFAEPWFRHGQVLQRLDRDVEAMRSYQRAVAANAGFAPAWTNIGTLMREVGRIGDAADAFRKARENGADDELNDYYLAAVGSGTVPATAPAAYVETLFDDYAEGFATHVVEALDYRAHSTLARTLQQIAPQRRFGRTLDLGCGTGLCGVLMKPLTGQLVGVDLSAGMLAEAEATKAYDVLSKNDIVEFMTLERSTFDLVTAADVFIYLGDVSPAFAAVRKVLANGGIFCFSVELAANLSTEFQLLPSLRYAHGERYLRKLASDHGFRVLQTSEGQIRHDQRQPIGGLFMFVTPD
ncbi:methyltransferase [Variovorax sp. RHLX14]|uniref:methyltransferase n=1 Tax=Variovorax sp. RHLX14 TaxID=1259731 RepID=UPI003F44CCEB